jgi:imidazolonepropionase-like amidohydrolase
MKNELRRAWLCAIPIVLLLVALAAWAHSARGEGGEPPYFAITNARIVPVSGPVIESGTVVIAKGLIQAVGASVTIPPEAWVIDGKGLTVYPGLIDTQTTIGLEQEGGDEAAPRAGGGRGRRSAPLSGEIIRDPEDRPSSTPWRIAADEIKTDDKRIESWRNAGFTTVLSAPEGGILPGQGSVIDLAGNRPGDYVVKSAATLQISLRPGGFFGFPDSLMGVIAYIRQVFDDVSWYQQADPIYQANMTKSARLRYDRTEQVVAAALQEKEIVLLPANNSVQILRGLRLADEWKIRAALYGGQEGYKVAAAIAAAKTPVLISLKWPERPKDADPDIPPSLRELRFRDLAPSTPAVFAKAGVKFAFYSDGLSGPKDIFKNLKKALDAGLAPDVALRALTLDAAGILGVGDRLGTIEPGKIANLVVADGDIFNDKTKVKHVFVDGHWFEVHEEASHDKPGDKKPMQSVDSVHAKTAGVSR